MECLPVILAGGFGKRLGHLTEKTPKPLLIVNKKPFLFWVLKFLKRNKLSKAVVSTGYLSNSFEIFLNDYNKVDFNLTLIKEKDALGTGGAILNVINNYSFSENKLLILNGDSLLLEDLDLDLNINHNCIWAKKVINSSKYGTLKLEKDSSFLKSFDEKVAGTGLVNAGIYLVDKSYFLNLNDKVLSMEKDVIPTFLKDNIKIKVIESPANFIDIGTPDDLLLAEKFIIKNSSFFD